MSKFVKQCQKILLHVMTCSKNYRVSEYHFPRVLEVARDPASAPMQSQDPQRNLILLRSHRKQRKTRCFYIESVPAKTVQQLTLALLKNLRNFSSVLFQWQFNSTWFLVFLLIEQKKIRRQLLRL
jgi:hypothetical protein